MICAFGDNLSGSRIILEPRALFQYVMNSISPNIALRRSMQNCSQIKQAKDHLESCAAPKVIPVDKTY